MLETGFDIALPYDREISDRMDFFTESEKEIWEALDQTERHASQMNCIEGRRCETKETSWVSHGLQAAAQ